MVASKSRATRFIVERTRVNATGDRRALCRISSEYALPMPLKQARVRQGALERVVLAATRRTRRRPRARRRTRRCRRGRPPTSAARPASRCSEARRRLPASVSTRRPVSNSNTASADFGAGLAARREPLQPAGDHQVDRRGTARPPAPASSATTTRLPRRSRPRNAPPLGAGRSAAAAVRSRNGL